MSAWLIATHAEWQACKDKKATLVESMDKVKLSYSQLTAQTADLTQQVLHMTSHVQSQVSIWSLQLKRRRLRTPTQSMQHCGATKAHMHAARHLSRCYGLHTSGGLCSRHLFLLVSVWLCLLNFLSLVLELLEVTDSKVLGIDMYDQF